MNNKLINHKPPLKIRIRMWLKTHNPKMLFCNHRYNIGGEECGPNGIYIYYRCGKCGKCITVESDHSTMMRTCKKD